MNLMRGFFLRAALFVLLAGSSVAATFISGVALEDHVSMGRSLLQAQKSNCILLLSLQIFVYFAKVRGCPINFEFMNYSIITSKCQGPQYAVNACCSAFKEFACPYRDEINDQTNDCFPTMLSYINLYGKYPPGLFSSECKEGKLGLDCSAYIRKPDNSTSVSSAHMNQSLFPFVSVVSWFIMPIVLRLI